MVGRFLAGARLADPRLLELRVVVLLGAGFLPVLRARVLELPRPVLLDVVEDVLLLREPGGEDVRVAMVINVIQSPTRHRDHTMRVGERPREAPAMLRLCQPS